MTPPKAEARASRRPCACARCSAAGRELPRAIDDPVQLARAAVIFRSAIDRQRAQSAAG